MNRCVIYNNKQTIEIDFHHKFLTYLKSMKPIDVTAARRTSSLTSETY